jgi:hypothetical protein
MNPHALPHSTTWIGENALLGVRRRNLKKCTRGAMRGLIRRTTCGVERECESILRSINGSREFLTTPRWLPVPLNVSQLSLNRTLTRWQLQSLLGNSSHHLHSLQVTSARRRPLQQDLLGWGPQFKGTFLMSPRGDMIEEFQQRRRGDLHKPQLPALHLHCPSARKPYAGD